MYLEEHLQVANQLINSTTSNFPLNMNLQENQRFSKIGWHETSKINNFLYPLKCSNLVDPYECTPTVYSNLPWRLYTLSLFPFKCTGYRATAASNQMVPPLNPLILIQQQPAASGPSKSVSNNASHNGINYPSSFSHM